MDKSPKRNRDKYNPYYLSSDKKNNIYIVRISNEYTTEDIEVNITKEVFDGINDLEKNEAKLIQRDKRYLIPNIYLTDNHKDVFSQEDNFSQEDKLEIIFYKNSKNKQKSLEEKIIEKVENEKLYKGLNSLSNIHRRRILLYFKHNLSYSQIAEIEGCSKMAIKYSIDKALEELRKFFLKKN